MTQTPAKQISRSRRRPCRSARAAATSETSTPPRETAEREAEAPVGWPNVSVTESAVCPNSAPPKFASAAIAATVPRSAIACGCERHGWQERRAAAGFGRCRPTFESGREPRGGDSGAFGAHPPKERSRGTTRSTARGVALLDRQGDLGCRGRRRHVSRAAGARPYRPSSEGAPSSSAISLGGERRATRCAISRTSVGDASTVMSSGRRTCGMLRRTLSSTVARSAPCRS